jgi:hypothetical protein
MVGKPLSYADAVNNNFLKPAMLQSFGRTKKLKYGRPIMDLRTSKTRIESRSAKILLLLNISALIVQEREQNSPTECRFNLQS